MHRHTHTHTYICIYVMEYYTGVEKNEILLFLSTHMHLEIIILMKSDGERKIDNISYKWSLRKVIQINLFTKQK